MDEERDKLLLISNESRDAKVTHYIYPSWDPICCTSFESKIIKPHEKYLYRTESRFNYKVVARFEDKRPTKTFLGPEEWVEDKLLKITEPLNLIVEKLANFPEEKTVCLRKLQRDKELKSANGRRNLYDILGLDMDQVRKMPVEEQRKAIKKGFRREIQRWHPDKNFGDDENAKEILMAQEILLDDEKRARYHNMADYDQGWVSLKRYKAIFWPECLTDEQIKAYRKRMFMFAMSLGITITGIALTVCTAGAVPATVVLGAVFGGGFIGAGLQSLKHTMNRESVVDECDVKQWGLKAGIGFVGGAATGGGAAGITAGVAGLGSAAVESAALTAGQYMGIGAGSGAVGGVASSLASDTGKFADGEHVTWKQVLGHAVCGATIGAVAGTAGGAVTKSIVGVQTSAASTNLKGEIGEQIAILTGARRLGNTLSRNVSRALTEDGTEAIMGSAAQFAEERLDDSVENRNPGEHIANGIKNVTVSAAKDVALKTGGALLSHASNEIKVKKKLKILLDDNDETRVVSKKKLITRAKVRGHLSKENNEHLVNSLIDSRNSFSGQPLDTEKPCKEFFNYQPLDTEEPCTNSCSWQPLDKEEPCKHLFSYQPLDTERPSLAVTDTTDFKLRYISEGHWISKMVVSYFLNGKKPRKK